MAADRGSPLWARSPHSDTHSARVRPRTRHVARRRPARDRAHRAIAPTPRFARVSSRAVRERAVPATARHARGDDDAVRERERAAVGLRVPARVGGDAAEERALEERRVRAGLAENPHVDLVGAGEPRPLKHQFGGRPGHPAQDRPALVGRQHVLGDELLEPVQQVEIVGGSATGKSHVLPQQFTHGGTVAREHVENGFFTQKLPYQHDIFLTYPK